MGNKKSTQWRSSNNNRRSIAEGVKSQERRKKYLKWKNTQELGKNLDERREIRQSIKKNQYRSNNYATAYVPENFSLISFPEEVLAFIAELKSLSYSRRNIFISMENVKIISHDAIAMLLSVLSKFKERSNKVYGDKPRNKTCNQILERSGFFNYVVGVIEEENKSTRNSILTKEEINVLPEKTAPLIRECMKTVGGTAIRNQAIQGMLIELMANTHNHASVNNKKTSWWLSIDHDKENNKVSFVFLDNGQGILKTINLKFFKKFGQFLFGNQVNLLKECFAGEIGSRTKFSNRGLGLPKIQNRFNEKFVSNLIVVTNNVFLQFEAKKGIELKNNFDGTLYYWELNTNCKPWIST